MASYFGCGNAVPAESDMLLVPSDYRFDATVRGIVYCHGQGGDALAGATPALVGQYRLVQALAQEFPVLVCDLGGTANWGNATAVARVGQARAYLQGAGGAKAGAVLLVGVSMGNVTALNYADAHPDAVAGVAGVIPASDMQAMRVVGVLRTEIDAAWGVTYPVALPAGANPATRPPAGVPYRAYYSTGDTVVVPSTVEALAAALGGTAVVISDLNHSEEATAQVPLPDLLAYLTACG